MAPLDYIVIPLSSTYISQAVILNLLFCHCTFHIIKLCHTSNNTLRESSPPSFLPSPHATPQPPLYSKTSTKPLFFCNSPFLHIFKLCPASNSTQVWSVFSFLFSPVQFASSSQPPLYSKTVTPNPSFCHGPFLYMPCPSSNVHPLVNPHLLPVPSHPADSLQSTSTPLS